MTIAQLKNSGAGFGYEVTVGLWNLAGAVETALSFVTSENKITAAYPYMVSMSVPSTECQVLSPIMKASSLSFKLFAGGRIANVADVETVGDLMTTQVWEGSVVTLELNAYPDAQPHTGNSTPIWHGRVVTARLLDRNVIEVKCVATYKYLDTPIPDDLITKADYPNAPDEYIGLTMPRVYGERHGVSRGYWASNSAFAERMGVRDLRNVIPCVCTDHNLDDASNGPVFQASDHIFHTSPSGLSSPNIEGVYLASPAAGQLAVADSSDYSLSNTSAGLAVTFDKDAQFSVHDTPRKAHPTDTSTNPEHAFDLDLTTYAVIAAGNQLMLTLPVIPDVGNIYIAEIRLLYDGDDVTFDTSLNTPTGAYGGTTTTNTTVPQTYAEVTHTLTGTFPQKASDFPSNPRLRINNVAAYGGGGATFLWIRQISLVLHYRPIIPIWVPASQARDSSDAALWQRRIRTRTSKSSEAALPTEDFKKIDDGDFRVFVLGKGTKDDGSGTYTGVASALIERPCDIAHHLIEDAASGMAATTSPGAFNATLRTRVDSSNLVMSTSMTEKKPLRALLEKIALQSGSAIITKVASAVTSDLVTGMIHWGAQAADNSYGTTISGDDISYFDTGHTHENDVCNAIYIHYAFDHYKKKTTKLAYVDSTGSDNGDGTDDASSALKTKLASSVSWFGRKELHITADLISDKDAAVGLRNLLAEILYWPRAQLKVRLRPKYAPIHCGHVLNFDNTSMLANRMKYPGKTGAAFGAWVDGGTTRYFWVTRASYLQIPAIELELEEGIW